MCVLTRWTPLVLRPAIAVIVVLRSVTGETLEALRKRSGCKKITMGQDTKTTLYSTITSNQSGLVKRQLGLDMTAARVSGESQTFDWRSDVVEVDAVGLRQATADQQQDQELQASVGVRAQGERHPLCLSGTTPAGETGGGGDDLHPHSSSVGTCEAGHACGAELGLG